MFDFMLELIFDFMFMLEFMLELIFDFIFIAELLLFSELNLELELEFDTIE